MSAILRGFVLALLSVVALAPVQGQTATSESLIIGSHRDAGSVSSSDSLIPTVHDEWRLTDVVGAVCEDSDEMLRVDIEQRAIGSHRITIEPKVSPAAVRNLRAIVSPPLLV